MWFVYVLLCANGSLYTGISPNPEERLLEHKKGRGGRYTRSHKPLKIIHLEKLSDKSRALKREFEIKSWTRDRKIQELRLRI